MGTMRERTPGTWELTVSAGLDPGTGRYRRVIRQIKTTSKREAKAALAELETTVANGRVSFDDQTVSELLDRWLEHITGLGRSATTLYSLSPVRGPRDRSCAWRNPTLEAVDTRDRCSVHKASQTRPRASDDPPDPCHPARVAEPSRTVGTRPAERRQAGIRARTTTARTASPVDHRCASADDIRDKPRPAVRTVHSSDGCNGSRRAEVCGLRWSDVDFEAGTLDVSRSYTVLPGVRGDSPTKSRSARTVKLDPDTVAALDFGWSAAKATSAMCGVSSERRRSGYIFAMDPTGRRAWRPDSANALWARARLAAGVSASIRLHDLRHFQATQLLDAGVPVPTVAARLGHADGTTTMKIYAHRTQRADQQAADVVGRLLGDAG